MNKITIIGEGFFIFEEVNSSLLTEGEDGTVLFIQDDLLYIYLKNSNIIKIIDVHQPENPVVVGRYELEGVERLLDFKISENIAYLLERLPTIGHYCLLTLLNITDPTNPVRIGCSTLESIITYRVNNTDRIGIYKNYAYVSSRELLIFDCSNRTLPVRVGIYPSSLGDVHVENDYLYLVSNGVTIYSLADPANPVILGAVESTKGISAGSGVYGNYVIIAYQDSAIQVYDCTDPSQPTICWFKDYWDWNLYIERNIHDMEIVEERLFIGGGELYIFDISNPQILKRRARLNIGDQNISRIILSNNYIYLTILNNIRIYSYVESFLARNIGIGISLSLSVVVGASILIFIVKRKRTR
jgi:hypothetical protein